MPNAAPAPDAPDASVADADQLAWARGLREQADWCEVELLVAAGLWADTHPPVPGAEAGPGTAFESDYLPAVAWQHTAEFSLAIGLSDAGGTGLIQDALQLRHRLPRTWQRLLAGKVTAWRARRIAQRCLHEADDVCSYLDGFVASVAHRVGLVTIDRLIDAALATLDPDEQERRRTEALERRRVRLYSQIGTDGTGLMEICADHKDLFDFDEVVSDLAAALAEHGDTDTLDVRRAKAIGVLADPAAAADLLETLDLLGNEPSSAHTTGSGTTGTETTGRESTGRDSDRARRPRRRPRKQIRLVLHLSADAVSGATSHSLGRCEINGGTAVLAEQVRDWCGRADTHLTVQPVIDLNGHTHVAAYEVPDRLRAIGALRDHTCVFPRCTRTAARCDLDHVIPWHPPDDPDPGGATCGYNLAPLCRRHHRLKTHTAWTYRVLAPGTYLWTSPGGAEYLRHQGGTSVVETCLQPRGPSQAE